jgi:hypothetical protein
MTSHRKWSPPFPVQVEKKRLHLRLAMQKSHDCDPYLKNYPFLNVYGEIDMLEPQLSNFDIDFFIFRIALSIMRPKFPEFEGGQNVAGKFGIDHNESEKM